MLVVGVDDISHDSQLYYWNSRRKPLANCFFKRDNSYIFYSLNVYL